MIRNIDDLIKYTENLVESIPSIAERILIKRNGCQPEIIEIIKQIFPGMPENYLSMIQLLNLEGISIGYFQLTPRLSKATNLIEGLSILNNPQEAPFYEMYKIHHVYEIASLEADPICIAYADGKFKKGQIVIYDLYEPSSEPGVLADTFEQFLLIAGNFNRIKRMYTKEEIVSKGYSDFFECLNSLDFLQKENILSTWKKISDIELH